MIHRRAILLLTLWASGLVGGQTLMNRPANSFLGGQVSPLLVGRSDLAAIEAGCRELTNVQVIDVGAVTRRPGSVYVATAPGSCCLYPFIYDEADAYALEFSSHLLRFYRNTGLILTGGSPYTISTPYEVNDVGTLQLSQSADVAYIVSSTGHYSPQKLVRSGHTSWSLTDCNSLFLGGPFRDQNTDTSITITPPALSADLTVGQMYLASSHSGSQIADKAFDDLFVANSGTYNGWVANSTTNEWVACHWGTAQKVNRITIWPYAPSSSIFNAAMVRHGKIEASQDGTSWTKISVIRWYGRCQGYNGDEVEIDTAISDPANSITLWLTNDTAYHYYRVYCYDGVPSGHYLALLEIEMRYSGSGTYTASQSLFQAGHVGSVWALRYNVAHVTDLTLSAAGWSAPVRISGAWSFTSSSTLVGSVEIQRSSDYGATWQMYRNWQLTASSAAPTLTGEERESNIWYRFSVTSYTSGTLAASLGVTGNAPPGIIQITAYASATQVQATIVDELDSADATSLWSEGAWSQYRGYPTTITSHFGRTVYAAGQTVWMTATDDYENFRNYTSADDEALTWQLSQSRQNPILWILGERNQNMVLGTLGKVMELRSLDELHGFTPTNPPKVMSVSAIGSGSAYPAIGDTAILLTDRTGRRIHELIYDATQETMVGPDITQIAGPILGTSGVVQMVFQPSPWPTLWCVRSDGELSSCYYNRPYHIAAWGTHNTTNGFYRSLAVVPTVGGLDRVWSVVERGSNYCVEYFADVDVEAGSLFLDSSQSYDGGAAVNLSAITKASPGHVTLSAALSSLANGLRVKMAEAVGMTQVNGLVFQVKNLNGGKTAFDLGDPDTGANWSTTNYTAYTSGGTVQRVAQTFTGLTHLAGQTVQIVGDGVYVGTGVVDGSGALAADDYYNTLEIGLGYTSTVTPMEVEMVTSSGSTQPSLKRITNLLISVYKTSGGKYGVPGGKLRPIDYAATASFDTIVNASSRHTGVFLPPILSGPVQQALYTLVQDEPYPFNLRAAVPVFSVSQP